MGSYQQINTEILAKRAGLSLLHIPFKGGGAEIIRDLANGDIQVSWFNITNPVGMMKAGRVRALAIAANERLPQHADVPTLTEVGFPGMRASQWVAAFAHSSVPADIVDTLHKAFAQAMTSPGLQEAFARGGMVAPKHASLEEARAWIKDEMASWKRDVDDVGIVVED
jgi:tripartite-type tricarboxylate transporter receptor subunit TctC